VPFFNCRREFFYFTKNESFKRETAKIHFCTAKIQLFSFCIVQILTEKPNKLQKSVE